MSLIALSKDILEFSRSLCNQLRIIKALIFLEKVFFSGVCFRFFSEADFKALEKFSTPEIQRVPLDSIVLQMVSMGLPDVRKFPFIEPPPVESLEESVMVLKAQDALNPDEVPMFLTFTFIRNLSVLRSICFTFIT